MNAPIDRLTAALSDRYRLEQADAVKLHRHSNVSIFLYYFLDR